MKRLKGSVVGIIAVFALLFGVLGLSGCSSNNDQGMDDQAQQSCVSTMDQASLTDAQNKLNQAKQNGLADPSIGVQQVCTINPQTGDIHYYHQNDGFRDYLLYAALTGRASSFGAMYMLSGGDPFDAILMDHFIGVNRYGTPFYPYSAYDGGYRRSPAVINNVTVNNVYSGPGAGSKMSYSDSLSPQNASKVGIKPTTLPKSSDVTGEGSLGDPKTGKPATKVAPVPGKNGQTDSASKPVKSVASGATVANPAKKGQTGAPAPGKKAPTNNKPTTGGTGSGIKSGSSKTGGSGIKSGGSSRSTSSGRR